MTCLNRAATKTESLGRILTRYRESPKLLAVIEHGIEQILDVADAICEIPEKHDILSAVGDQLTNVGKRLGWPRCHCVCSDPAPVWAWDCAPASPTLIYVDICDDSGCWEDTSDIGASQLCLDNDDVYRGYLLARRFQALQLYDIASLHAAAQHIWGSQALAYSIGDGNVAIAPNRELNADERRQLPLAFRVLPIAPGIAPNVDLSYPIWGMGVGWADMCVGQWACPQPFDPYNCT